MAINTFKNSSNLANYCPKIFLRENIIKSQIIQTELHNYRIFPFITFSITKKKHYALCPTDTVDGKSTTLLATIWVKLHDR